MFDVLFGFQLKVFLKLCTQRNYDDIYVLNVIEVENRWLRASSRNTLP